jgi:hypothetical protein
MRTITMLVKGHNFINPYCGLFFVRSWKKLKCWEQRGIPLQQGSGDNAVACTWLAILSNMGPHGQWEIPRVSSEKVGMDVIPYPDHMKIY